MRRVRSDPSAMSSIDILKAGDPNRGGGRLLRTKTDILQRDKWEGTKKPWGDNLPDSPSKDGGNGNVEAQDEDEGTRGPEHGRLMQRSPIGGGRGGGSKGGEGGRGEERASPPTSAPPPAPLPLPPHLLSPSLESTLASTWGCVNSPSNFGEPSLILAAFSTKSRNGSEERQPG